MDRNEYPVILTNEPNDGLTINLSDITGTVKLIDTPKGKLLSAILENYPDTIMIKPMGTKDFDTGKFTLTGFTIVDYGPKN